ncbi:hypothetical protein F5Y03DRAFT_409438 [Xylaria venustula]|nr:hypothetical protein F5Y03DRAFT_409438 [Xylaria venustula]
MCDIPKDTFGVVTFERKVAVHSDRPECQVFRVKSIKEPHVKEKVWWTKEGYEELKNRYDNLPEFEDENQRGGFVKGRPMMDLAAQISTCTGSKRPRILYRVVHEQQPHYGRKARGYDIVKPTSLNFDTLVKKHLNWKSRHPSPFISVTDSRSKAHRIVKVLQEHGLTGIQIIKFRSNGVGWNHKTQRLFHARTLCKQLHETHYVDMPFLRNEYLLESHIPDESIIKIKKLDDVNYGREPKLRKPAGNLAKERKVSAKRSKGFKREK